MFNNLVFPRLLPRSVFEINPGLIWNMDFLLAGNFSQPDSVMEAISHFMDHPEFFEERRTGLILPMPEKLHPDQFEFASMFSHLLLISPDDFYWNKKQITSGTGRSAMKSDDFRKMLGPEWGNRRNTLLLLERNAQSQITGIFPAGWELKAELGSLSILDNPRRLDTYLSRQLSYGLRLNSLRERFRLEITHQGRIMNERRFYLSPSSSVFFLFLLALRKNAQSEIASVSWSEFRILLKNNAALFHRIDTLLRPVRNDGAGYFNLEVIDKDRAQLERNLSEVKTVFRSVNSAHGSIRENTSLEISEAARSSVYWPEIATGLAALLNEKLGISLTRC
jgi:hypothetical protein